MIQACWCLPKTAFISCTQFTVFCHAICTNYSKWKKKKKIILWNPNLTQRKKKIRDILIAFLRNLTITEEYLFQFLEASRSKICKMLNMWDTKLAAYLIWCHIFSMCVQLAQIPDHSEIHTRQFISWWGPDLAPWILLTLLSRTEVYIYSLH